MIMLTRDFLKKACSSVFLTESALTPLLEVLGGIGLLCLFFGDNRKHRLPLPARLIILIPSRFWTLAMDKEYSCVNASTAVQHPSKLQNSLIAASSPNPYPSATGMLSFT